MTIAFQELTVARPTIMTDGSEGWVAEDRMRPGCIGYGPTPEEARESLQRAREAYDAAVAGRGADEDDLSDLWRSGLDDDTSSDSLEWTNAPEGVETATR